MYVRNILKLYWNVRRKPNDGNTDLTSPNKNDIMTANLRFTRRQGYGTDIRTGVFR